MPGIGLKGQNVFLKGPVAYIKGNDAYNNMQAIILFLHALSTPGVRSKFKGFFSEIGRVSYQRELNLRSHANILRLHTPPTIGWDKRSKLFL